MTNRTVATDKTAELVATGALPLSKNPAAVYLATLSPGSRRAMRHALDVIANIASGGTLDAEGLRWARLRYEHTTAIRARLAADYAPATVNRMLSALRGTLKQAWKLGQIDADDYRKAASIESVRGERLPAGRDIAEGERVALMAACEAEQSPGGVRDAAVIAVLYTCGLRRAELVALNLADYDQDAGDLQVRGKGNKERKVYPTSGASDALADWLLIRGDAPGPLFWPVTKAGKLRPRRLTTQAIYKALAKRADQAGVKDLSPHDFRRTVAGDLLDAGADLATVQKLLGHEDPKTTARYDRRDERAKRKAAGLLHIPYHRQVLRGDQ